MCVCVSEKEHENTKTQPTKNTKRGMPSAHPHRFLYAPVLEMAEAMAFWTSGNTRRSAADAVVLDATGRTNGTSSEGAAPTIVAVRVDTAVETGEGVGALLAGLAAGLAPKKPPCRPENIPPPPRPLAGLMAVVVVVVTGADAGAGAGAGTGVAGTGVGVDADDEDDAGVGTRRRGAAAAGGGACCADRRRARWAVMSSSSGTVADMDQCKGRLKSQEDR